MNRIDGWGVSSGGGQHQNMGQDPLEGESSPAAAASPPLIPFGLGTGVLEHQMLHLVTTTTVTMVTLFWFIQPHFCCFHHAAAPCLQHKVIFRAAVDIVQKS